MPTDEEIKAYADKLPAIYRNVLASFPGVSPSRRSGDMLSLSTIYAYVSHHYSEHREDDINDALRRLKDRGFVENWRDLGFAYHPTPIGERLITAITGHQSIPAEIPELPIPTWG